MPHLDPIHRQIIGEILTRHVPTCAVWLFGSRHHGRNLKPFSDVDLAIIAEQPLEPARLAALREAFSHSDLPMKVDLVEWALASPKFRTLIAAEHEVIQHAR